MTIIPLRWWLVLAAVLYLMPIRVHAEPFAKASNGDITITLYTEKCDLKEVTNLPQRATWDEKGQHYEGCFGWNGQVIMAYFSDKTVAGIPPSIFVKVTGA